MLDLNDLKIAVELEELVARIREEIKPLTGPLKRLASRDSDYEIRFNPCDIDYNPYS